MDELIKRSETLSEIHEELANQGTMYNQDKLIEIVDDVVNLIGVIDEDDVEEKLKCAHQLLEDKWGVEFPVVEEEKIPVTLATIKAICGWSRYCEVTGANEWMLNEHHVEDTEIFHVKKSHAIELGLAR